MNDGELNGLVLASVCVIFYYALRFVMWLWDSEQKRMDEFSSQMDALKSRTQEAEKLADGLTPDRTSSGIVYDVFQANKRNEEFRLEAQIRQAADYGRYMRMAKLEIDEMLEDK